MGHYDSCYEADEERQRTEDCTTYRKWITDKIKGIKNPEELKLIYAIASNSKQASAGLDLLRKLINEDY